VKEILVLEEGPGWRFSGKTGAYSTGEGDRMVTWLVGYVERDGNVYVFASNAEGPSDAVFPSRATRPRAILAHLGLLPPS
jgi:beta-lactamase class D